MMAARSLIGLYRQTMPDMLRKKDRGRPTEANIALEPMKYGDVSAKDFIPGADVLLDKTSDGLEIDSENSDVSNLIVIEKILCLSNFILEWIFLQDDEWIDVQHSSDEDVKKDDEVNDSECDDENDDEGCDSSSNDGEEDDECVSEDEEVDSDEDNDSENEEEEKKNENVNKKKVIKKEEDKKDSKSKVSVKVLRLQKRREKAKIERKKRKLEEKRKLIERMKTQRKTEYTAEKKAKASQVSVERILTDDDFKRIDMALVKQQVTHAKKGTKRPLEDDKSKGELVKLGDIENIYKKRKHDKQARIESVQVK